MSNLRRIPYTKPIPPGAEIITRKGKRLARFKNSKGRIVEAPLTEDGRRVRLLSKKYYGEYRDADGVEQCVPLCADRTAAEQMLAGRVKQAQRIEAGVLTEGELQQAQHHKAPIVEHLDAYRDHQRAAGFTAKHIDEARGRLDRLILECGFPTLASLNREAFERWLAERAKEGMSARTRNAYRENLVAFCNWCLDCNPPRLGANHFARIHKANVKADPRRQRRAMTEEELRRLLEAARQRPLQDDAIKKNPALRAGRELVGRERALQYKTLVLTGLRKGELESLAVGQLSLDGPGGFLTLDAADEKNREGNTVPLRPDLAEDLRGWLASKLHRLQEQARQDGKPVPLRLPAGIPLFDVPKNLLRQLDRDLIAAGIARWVKVGDRWKIDKRDERGRTLDVHALRTTFGTLMSKGGVAPRTAQAAMRHSDINLTMGIYTDPKLLDVRAALDVLPDLPLDPTDAAARATGTEGAGPKACAQLAPITDGTRDSVRLPEKGKGRGRKGRSA